MKPVSKLNKKYLFILIGIISLAFLGLKNIELQRKSIFTPDEYVFSLLSRQVALNPLDYNTVEFYETQKRLNTKINLYDYFKAPLYKHPPLLAYLLSLPQRFAPLQNRDINYFAFYLAFLIPFIVYRLALVIYNQRVAVLSFVFFIISPVFWLCSSRIWLASLLTLCTTLSLLFFVTEIKHKKYVFLCGLFLGFGILTKYPAFLLIPIYLIFAIIYAPELLKKPRLYFIFITAFIVFLPWLLWNLKVYGGFNIGSKPDSSTKIYIGAFLSLLKPQIIAALAITAFTLWIAAVNGHIAKIEQKIRKNKVFLYLLILLFISGIFFVKDIRRGFFESLCLHCLPPVSNAYPSIFRKEAWSFYLGQLLKMSPLFILSYGAVFNLRSKSKGDKLLLLCSFITLAFYILWGNYQSRYILSAVPALAILAARVFFWLWDAIGRIPNKLAQSWARSGLTSFLIYALVKTAIVDYRLTMALFGKGYFTYF